MKTTKKIISLIFVLAMCLFLATPAMATEPNRVEIIVESEDEIIEFINSPQYNPNNLYTFTYTYPSKMRILCPNCGYNTYRGATEDVEYDIFVRNCPMMSTTLASDIGTVYKIYTYSYCITCGYETTHTYAGTKYLIDCYMGFQFWAKDGQTMAGGYDIHECKSSWNY